MAGLHFKVRKKYSFKKILTRCWKILLDNKLEVAKPVRDIFQWEINSKDGENWSKTQRVGRDCNMFLVEDQFVETKALSQQKYLMFLTSKQISKVIRSWFYLKGRGQSAKNSPCKLSSYEKANLVVKNRTWKNSGPYRIWTHDLCTGLNFFQVLFSTTSLVVFLAARFS